jgi:hypothetical protein
MNTFLSFKEIRVFENKRPVTLIFPVHTIKISSSIYKKGALVHSMKSYRGSRSIAPPIPNIGFNPGKERRCPQNKTLGRPQSRSGRFGEVENFLPLPGFES